MKVAACSIVHYGSDYIGWALRSVCEVVDLCHVVYTATPSHGHTTDAQPIESRADILIAAGRFCRNVHFHEIKGATEEWQHRDAAIKICKGHGADLILVLDADEVWHEDVLRSALVYAWEKNSARNWLINFVHLWRSFDTCCRDDAWPVRIIDLRHVNGVGYIPRELGEIYHFGYAVTDKVMNYKMLIHGHKDELRPDWFATKWAAWPPVGDCHPTNGPKTDGSGWWDPEPFDKARLPAFMQEHPFWGRERVE